MKKIDIEEN